MDQSRWAYGYVALAIMGWSTAATAFELGLRHVDAVQLLSLATLSSSGILGLALTLQGKLPLLKQQTRDQIKLSALQGLINPFGYYLILFQAYDRLPAQAAMALNYTWPLTLALLSVPILGESLRRATLIAIGISLAGVLLIATQGDLSTLQLDDPIGVALALGSSILWASYWLMNVRDRRDAGVKLLMGFTFGTLYTWLSLPILSSVVEPTEKILAIGGYIGLAEMGLAFVCWLKALELASDKGAIANVVYISPFLSLVWIAVVLQESVRLSSVVGLVLIVLSILWQSRQAKAS